MELYAYCIMPNHVHLLFRSALEQPSDLIRDFKGYTSKQLIKEIKLNPQESRRDWLLREFELKKHIKRKDRKYQLWQPHNNPIEIWSTGALKQKINYIHDNPVQAGLVMRPWEYKYSSARNFAELDSVMEIDDIGFLG